MQERKRFADWVLANPDTVISGMAVKDWLVATFEEAISPQLYAKEVLRSRFFLGAFEMIIFAAIYNCNVCAFEDFDESTFLRWQRVDAPHPDATAQDRFVYWQSHSNGHFDELRWIDPGAHSDVPLASNEGQQSKNAAAMK